MKWYFWSFWQILNPDSPEIVRSWCAKRTWLEKKILTVSSVLYLQEQFKQQTGVEYKPGMAPPASTPAPPTSSSDSTSCPYTRVAQQGELVKKLKAQQAPKVKGIFQSMITSSSVCQIIILRPTLLVFVSPFIIRWILASKITCLVLPSWCPTSFVQWPFHLLVPFAWQSSLFWNTHYYKITFNGTRTRLTLQWSSSSLSRQSLKSWPVRIINQGWSHPPPLLHLPWLPPLLPCHLLLLWACMSVLHSKER